MKRSIRAKRMARHHRRQASSSKLNLVSLMDIFTILVFFLMVNSSDVQVLDSNKAIKLPSSIAQTKPEETLVLMVTAKDLIVQGRSIVDVAGILSQDEEFITALDKELRYQASRRRALSEEEAKSGRAVTIMGDEKIPYSLLKKVMATCAQADFRNISLAVNQLASTAGQASVEG